MWLGIPTIATCSVGTVDYIEHGKTGLLVPALDPVALRAAIFTLLNDEKMRLRVGVAGRDKAMRCFSDEAAGESFGRILNRLLSQNA